MVYTDCLNKQIKECSNKILLLRSKIKLNPNSSKKGMFLMELENTKMHMFSLKKLMTMFENIQTCN